MGILVCKDKAASTVPCLIPLTEQEPGSLHFHRGRSGAKGYGVAVASSDYWSLQPCAESVRDQQHRPRGSRRSAAEHHRWRQEGEQLLPTLSK